MFTCWNDNCIHYNKLTTQLSLTVGTLKLAPELNYQWTTTITRFVTINIIAKIIITEHHILLARLITKTETNKIINLKKCA